MTCSGFATLKPARSTSKWLAAEDAHVPWKMPGVDADIVKEVLSGKRDLRRHLEGLALNPEVEESFDMDLACPTGTRPCPKDCRSIHVWGLTRYADLDVLQYWCSAFGEEVDLNFITPGIDWDQAYATITFADSSTAETALYCLHSTRLEFDGKVCLEQGLNAWGVEVPFPMPHLSLHVLNVAWVRYNIISHVFGMLRIRSKSWLIVNVRRVIAKYITYTLH
jgi:hypothetical protein